MIHKLLLPQIIVKIYELLFLKNTEGGTIMDNLFRPEMNLMEMEQHLQTYFSQRENYHHQLICKIPLSPADCRLMVQKFDSLTRFENEIGIYEDLALSIIVMWTFCNKYNIYKNDFLNRLIHHTDSLPQHRGRYYKVMLFPVFDEYGLETFGRNINTIEIMCEVIDMHVKIS